MNPHTDPDQCHLYFCGPCVMHGRSTIVVADSQPTWPCAHAGQGRDDCKRVEWRRREFYCTRCSDIGWTTITHADEYPAGRPCPQFPRVHVGYWEETTDSKLGTRAVSRFAHVPGPITTEGI